MGKQVAIAMLEQDEAEFLAFLRSTADVRLYRSSAPSAEALAVDAFSEEGPVCWQFFIWNTAFRWQPSIGYVPDNAPVTARRGWAYLSNTGTAPVIVYDRHNFRNSNSQGRIYWAKVFRASEPLGYDVGEFERWYNQVARWVRKHGRRDKSENYGPYYLPHAFSNHGGAL
jgi:hypothetical protein